MRDAAGKAEARAPMRVLALVYTVFVVYGSLVPLEFRPLPWNEAVARFGAMPFLRLGIGSRADWMANLLLFIPLTFIWTGVLAAGGGLARRAAATLVVIPVATALSLGIEFAQLFFPQRTVSQNDVFAETLGGVLGVALWWIAGARFTAWLRAWRHAHARDALAERIAWTYFAGVLVYNVLPLDLTISAVEIFHKWQDGRVNLIPFARLPSDPFFAIYEVATDALIWAPLALLWRMEGTRGPRRAWGMTVATAAALEAMQLFVFSRVSDVTDLFTAAVGALLGTAVASRLRRGPAWRDTVPGQVGVSSLRRWMPFGLAALWMAGLGLVFWFPFDFRTDGAFVRSRLDFVLRVPFEVYYFGTEYRAITEVLRKTLFFAPLGALLAWGVAVQPWRLRAPLFVLALMLLTAMPAAIELGQVMLPHKIPDTTDGFLAWIGGLAGYAVARRFARAPRVASPPSRTTPGEIETAKPAAPSGAWHLALSVGGLALALWGLGQASFVPYNVRELLRHDSPALSALLLAAVCYWIAAWPVWLARRTVSPGGRMIQLPLGLLVYGLVAFLALRLAVPEESLHDLVGSPVLGWGGQWETAVRWVALAAVPGALLYLAAQSVRRWRGRSLGASHFWVALPVLAVAYWAVVHRAATDNLVELLAAPRPFAFAVLCAALYVLFLAAALLASPARGSRRFATFVAVGLSLPLAGLLVHLGLAADIDKYGQRFSALQFLLSADRQNYAAPAYVWLRYAGVHLLVIAALAFIQWPHFRSARRSHARAPDASY